MKTNLGKRASIVALSLVSILNTPGLSAQQSDSNLSEQRLIDLMKSKGILTDADLAQIKQPQTKGAGDHELADVLLKKGIINATEYNSLVGNAKAAVAPKPAHLQLAVATEPPMAKPVASNARPQQPPNPTSPGAPAIVEKPAFTGLNEALVPVRVFPVGAMKRESNPALKVNGVGFTPYGFIKVTAVQDSSSPNGDDFPLPGFLTDTGPEGAPEFHLKARSSRFGVNLSWTDSNPKWIISGKIEGDFEGNYNRSDNRNLSSVRSSNPSLRLAWGRLDYQFNANNSFSALFGQDWTLFGSSTLPNILETTGLAVGDGTLYERDPQMRVGFAHKAGALTIMPEFSIDLPAAGLTPNAANISAQLGYGERQGPDSGQPELQGRIAAQWQLDHAPGVPPAQIIFSGFTGERTGIVLASAVPAAYLTTFAQGATATSKRNGWDGEWQLPTRWFTLVGKVYGGADLRWFFSGQLYSFFQDTVGLHNTITVASQDGSSNLVFGTTASGQQVIAPERPVRAAGGFVQLGLPLSRIFNANPAGRMSGWSLYGMYGEDQAKTRDINRCAGTRRESSAMIGTLNYKFNRWLSFSYEQSLYTTHANPEQTLPLFRGVHAREWNDVREEGGPIFFF